MERILVIKTKQYPDPSTQYPSERRYSASLVLGFSAVFLTFSILALIMGFLMIQKMYLPENELNDNLAKKVSEDLKYSNPGYLTYYIRIPFLIVCGSFVMGCGNLAAFITGILAWRFWYVDQNITYFFLSCIASTITSALCLFIIIITYSKMDFGYVDAQDQQAPGRSSFLSVSQVANEAVFSVISVVWSLLGTKLGYHGMTSRYPEDAMESGRNVALKQNKGRALQNNIPIEMVSRFAAESIADVLPTKENYDLPKQETTVEYQQRVNEFLSASETEPSANHVTSTD